MTEAIEKRLEELRRKLAARKGQKPYKKNCEAIQAEISRLENILLNAKENPDPIVAAIADDIANGRTESQQP